MKKAHPFTGGLSHTSSCSNPNVGRVVRKHVDALAALIEVYLAVGDGEEEIVLGPANVAASGVLRAALDDDDAADADLFPGIKFNAPPLRVRVAPVSDRALALLVCHGVMPFR